MLTDRECRAAGPKAKAYKLFDAGGLYLFVTPSGFKSWRLKYRVAGQEKRLTFGAYPEVTLAAARTKRDEAKRAIGNGRDPAIEKKQRAAAARIDAANTFTAIADQWQALNRERWTDRHADNVKRSLERDVYPKFGKLPLREVTVPLVLDAVRSIEKRGARETARRVRQRIEEVFAMAIVDGVVDQNPAAAITPAALAPVIKRKFPAYRSIEPARTLLTRSEGEPAQPLTLLASRLLALTAVRPGMIANACPAEFFDLDGKAPRWDIPAAKMKLSAENKADGSFNFTVPLSRQAVEVVKAALTLTARLPFLFPNARHSHKPMSENALSSLYKRLPEVRGKHVPHGWRSTFSTIMNELAMEADRPGDRAVIDLMLAHVPEGVEPTYNRAAYMKRRREIAQAWADMLMKDMPPAAQLLEVKRN